MDKALLGLFPYVDTLLSAAERLQGAGYGVTVLSPIPLGHEIEKSLGPRKNHIRYFALAGCIVGFCSGIALTLGTALLYVLPRGGMPLFFYTPTLLLSYETAILTGVFWTLLSFFFFARLPWYGKKVYHPVVNEDAFGLLIEEIRHDKMDEVEGIMKEAGASEVKRLDRPC